MSSADNQTDTSVAKAETGANVPSASQPFFKRRLVLLVVVIVIVLAAAASGLYYWHKHEQKKPVAAQQPGQSAINTAIAQSNNGNTNSALTTLNTAIQNTSNKTQKAALYQQQGNTYESTNNYQAALNSYQQSAQNGGLSYGLAVSTAESAQAAGNNQLAIEYYQKAISLIPSNDPTGGVEKNSYEQTINMLKSQ